MSATATENPTDTVALAVRRAALEARFPAWRRLALFERLECVAAEFPNRPFVITDEETLSYSEVTERALRYAAGLRELGVRAGDHVGMLIANYPEFVPVKFAVAALGAVAVPLNYLYRSRELGYVLRQSDCRVLVTMTGFAGLDYLDMLDEISPGWSDADHLSDEGIPALRHVVQLSTDGRSRVGVQSLADLGARQALTPADLPRVAPGSTSDLLYTSGTTGFPKGVVVSHDAVQRTGYASALTRAFEDGRRTLFSLPCYHMFGYIEGLIAVMMVGGAVILRTVFSPESYLSGIQDHRATDILAVPTMAVALLEYPEKSRFDLSSLRAILCGASPGPAWLWQQVASELGATEIVTGYGMTETGGAMTLSRPEDSYEVTASTVGKPKLAGVAGIAERGGELVHYRVVHSETGEPVPAGESGELISQGHTQMRGYWRDPEATELGIRDGWVYSGDLGRIGPDGYLEVTGRSKELYRSGGELIMPKEIENLLTEHPGVSQAYAVGVPDLRWGEAGWVFVVRAPGAQLTVEDIRELCTLKLARFKVPKRVEFLEAEELPLTPTGKVQKFRLVELAQQRLEAEHDPEH